MSVFEDIFGSSCRGCNSCLSSGSNETYVEEEWLVFSKVTIHRSHVHYIRKNGEGVAEVILFPHGSNVAGGIVSTGDQYDEVKGKFE
jgi:hypothetical protein